MVLERTRSTEPQHRLFLVAGHMVDKSTRPTPRFPQKAIPIAKRAIERTLDHFNVGPNDEAVSGGACGADLLFAEACLERGMRLRMYLALPEGEFLSQSVLYAGPDWLETFKRVKHHPRAEIIQLLASHENFSATNPFERANQHLADRARKHGLNHVNVICLWNGTSGDGPGGTEDLVRTLKNEGVRVYTIDTCSLWRHDDSGEFESLEKML